jgi:palmitoyl-protein thioesterase
MIISTLFLYNLYLTGLTLSSTKQTHPTHHEATPLPIVLMHGILSDVSKVSHVAEWLHNNTGADVYTTEIGNGQQDSIKLPMATQRDIFCGIIYNNSALAQGFNLIGISQGGLIARGYVEHCNRYPVHNLITWVTPHGGVYNFPYPEIYSPESQATSSYSNYWRDPYNYNTYLTQSTYLADLNNEHISTQRATESIRYKSNMVSLSNFVMVWSPLDDVLEPPESGKFSTYEPATYGNPKRVVPLQESWFYNLDTLGLKTLDTQGKIHIYETDCDHADHVTPACLEAWAHYTLPYLV